MSRIKDEATATSDRATLHRLVDGLRSEDVPTAKRVLEAMNASVDSVLSAVERAPLDDEPEADEEREAASRARDDRKQGRLLSHEELRKRQRR